MKVTIIGAGAVGSVIGGMLSRDHDVTLVGRVDHVKAIRKNGLIIEGEGVFRVKAETDTGAVPVQDLVVITVKAHDLDRAVQDSKRLIGPGTLLLVVQNGLSVLAAPTRVSFARTCIGVAYMGATMIGPGKVRSVSRTKIVVGCVDGRTAQPTLLTHVLNGSGLHSEVTDDIIGDVWRKTLVNAAVNPVTAILMAPNGAILKDPRALAISEKLFEEAMAVARHWNILNEGEMSYDDVEKVIRATADNRSSMLQDLENGKRTEIDAINGAICDRSPDPKMVRVNSRMVELVKALETWRARDGG
ncbi:MAG: 2-dehydropantoate 2-reductase [Euryarchaeota archaeon]|nr:2-dehydropantoate 2-reductase [Euryarchaeota archaeon]